MLCTSDGMLSIRWRCRCKCSSADISPLHLYVAGKPRGGGWCPQPLNQMGKSMTEVLKLSLIGDCAWLSRAAWPGVNEHRTYMCARYFISLPPVGGSGAGVGEILAMLSVSGRVPGGLECVSPRGGKLVVQ